MSDTVYLDESVVLSDGSLRNPFEASAPGLLDLVAASLASVRAEPDYPNTLYYSGILTTLPSFHQDWGYYEVVVKMPPSPGAWGAFFLYPFSDYPSATSTSGEMDFFESDGEAPKAINTTMHDYMKPALSRPTVTSDTPLDLTASFNTIGFDFEPGGVTRYLNDAKFDSAPLPVPADWTGKTWYIVISQDADRSTMPFWSNNVPQDSSYPKHMQVKSVRVFKTSSTTVIGGSAALITL